MKRSARIGGALLGAVALAALVLGLIVNAGRLRSAPAGSVPAAPLASVLESPFRSPIHTPTAPPLPSPTPVPTTLPPTATPRPSVTAYWHPTPRPTPVRPGGPTPTALPLVTPRADARGSLFFVAEPGEGPRALYDLPVDGRGQPTSAPAEVPLAAIQWRIERSARLYPAPRGPYLALVQATGGPPDFITIVDRVSGRLLPFYEALRETPSVGWWGGWHLDGRHVLYIDRQRETGLWLVDVEGREPPRLLFEYAPDAAAISPDGQTLAYAVRNWSPELDQPVQVEYALWLARSDGTDARRVVKIPPGMGIAHIVWSPDGSRLAFVHDSELRVIQADGTGERLLSRHWAAGWGFAPPVWSPDGQTLAFPALEGEMGSDAFSEAGTYRYVGIHLVDVATGRERRLLPDEATGSLSPAWSPDGSRLAFLSTRSGSPQMWTIGADGSGLAQLTTGDAWRSGPAWLSPEEH